MTYLRRTTTTTLFVGAVLCVAALFSPSAHAATPPDSCFAFNAGTGTITDYYDHESNNPANPACTREVDIPITIGGTSVTSIGTNAFSYNQLTTVTIPTSVTSISHSAFSNNKLTTVTIENAAATMQHSSFVGNPITTMTIGATTYAEQSPTTELACFAISGTIITDYYQASPLIVRDNGVLCGRNVTIPSGVTSTGNNAFSSNQLTTVTIPNSVTSIGNRTFSSNKLTSITIPGGVTSIGSSAFAWNQLSEISLPNSLTTIGSSAFQVNKIPSVVIPDSVTSLSPSTFTLQNEWGDRIDRPCADLNPAPCMWSSDDNEVDRAYESIWYTKVYTQSPNNPNNLRDSILTENNYSYSDYNGNGINDSFGGHIVNPSSLTLNYVNQSNIQLDTSFMFVGKLSGGDYLTRHFTADGPDTPDVIDTDNPTPTEQAAIDEALSAYYRIGDSVTIDPPMIDGYITPPTQTFVLGAADNTFSYVYTLPAGTSTPSTTGGGLAATGAPLFVYVAGAAMMSILGAAMLTRRL